MGKGLRMKKLRLTSTNRRAYQSSGMDDKTPSKNAWSFSSPRGQRKYGPLLGMSTSGGIRAARTVRESVALETSLNATRGAKQGRVFGFRRC